MIDLSLKSEIKNITKSFDSLARDQIPFATALTLNQIAFKAREKTVKTMKQVFNKPTPWVLRSVRYQKASKRILAAKVGLDDFAAKGIPGRTMTSPHVYGGTRRMKRVEQRFGAYLYPGKSAKLNKYGNLTPGRIAKALSDTGYQRDPAQNTKNTKKKYFVIRKGGRVIIMERQSKRSVVPFLIEGSAPNYRKRFPFNKVILSVSKRNFSKLFNENIKHALATSK